MSTMTDQNLGPQKEYPSSRRDLLPIEESDVVIGSTSDDADEGALRLCSMLLSSQYATGSHPP